jgi:carbamoyl-phosphate synthase large subunit
LPPAKPSNDLGLFEDLKTQGFFVKEAIFPFMKFPGADAVLGPEMRSTGEVMGHANKFGHAFWKAQLATHTALPIRGKVVVTVNDKDKGAIMKIARDLQNFRLPFVVYWWHSRCSRNCKCHGGAHQEVE